MILLFRLAIILSRISLIIAGMIVAVLFLAVCYVAQDDDELDRERMMREGT